jgi:hypothetical protein
MMLIDPAPRVAGQNVGWPVRFHRGGPARSILRHAKGASAIDLGAAGRQTCRGRSQLERFRAKWKPVGVKKTQQNKNLAFRF